MQINDYLFSEQRDRQQLVHQDLSHTLMAFIIRMQTVVVCMMEVLGILIHKRIKATKRIQVNDRNSPQISALFDRLHISIDIFTTLIGIVLPRLPVFSLA